MEELRSLATDRDDRIIVEAATGKVRRYETIITLSGREQELALAIALHEQPAATIRLTDLLYPDREYAEAANIVKVYVSRLRKRVGRDFIRWKDGGYVLGSHVQLDLALARALVDGLSRSPAVPAASERDATLALARGLRRESPARLVEQEWFMAFARRARWVGHELALLVGRCALRHGNAGEAIRVAQELTYEDPCDEEAWELLIHGHVTLGQHLAAIQGFRFYESVLAAELDTAPSPHIRRLLADACAYTGRSSLTA